MISVTASDSQSQFTICRREDSAGGHRIEIGGWAISHGERYPLTKIIDKNDTLVGAFIGFVVDLPTRVFKPEKVTLDWDVQSGSQRLLEELLYQCAGSWVAIISTGEIEAIYLDACGSLPLVYFKEVRACASSAAALLSEDEYWRELYPEAHSEAWFQADWYHTAGLTAHKSLLRLLPNHRLDLRRWTVERIWPREPFPQLETDSAVKEIATASGEIIETVMQNAKLALVPLTAGNETRALLSLSKNFRQCALYFTGSFPGAVVDVGVANRLAIRFGLRHVQTSVRPRTPEEVEIWRYQTGHCIGGAIGASKMDRSKFAEADVEFSGAAGEVGRGFLWSPDDKAHDKLSSDVMLARLKLPKIDRFISAVDNWLASVSEFDAFTVMDLAYIELKMACWAGPQATGSETGVPQIWPLSSRRCFSAMISAPPSVRLEQSIFRRIVAREWPQLLEVPINKGTALENIRKLLHRLSSPRRILNRIRKDLAKIKPAREQP